MVKPRRVLVSIAIVVVVVFAAWAVAFPDPRDPKNLRYRGWRLGLCSINLDALQAMVIDNHRDDLVIGKTRDQMVSRFGFVASIDEASQYIKKCYANSSDRVTPVLFLRHSEWMVRMKDGKAAELVFVKGC